MERPYLAFAPLSVKFHGGDAPVLLAELCCLMPLPVEPLHVLTCRDER